MITLMILKLLIQIQIISFYTMKHLYIYKDKTNIGVIEDLLWIVLMSCSSTKSRKKVRLLYSVIFRINNFVY